MNTDRRQTRSHRTPEPLDAGGLERLALHYVGRYAVTRAKLRSYLERKLRERGWCGEGSPQGDSGHVEALVTRFADLGYVDDRAFATSRAEALGRRGYGKRRVGQALKVAGIEEEDSVDAFDQADADAWPAARRFAERKGIGPFAATFPERPEREKALAAMLRAGHPLDIARRLVNARPGESVDED